ncbi:MAG: ATP-binding protein [Candidatus Hydrothermarchaeales archaeon]
MEFLFKEWQEIWVPELKERDIGLEILPEKIRKILTFTGIRRAGKTYMMFQLIKQLSKSVPKEKVFYVNFEDERIERTKENLTNLIPILTKLYGNKDYFLFLDEIQVMPEWSRWLRRTYDTYRNINFFVSGSSSKLSSKEIPTELRGRALNCEVFPLSFKEFLRFNDIELERHFEYSERKLSTLKRALGEYIEHGGFPEVVLEDSILKKKRLVQEYFKTIIGRDIGERHRVKKLYLLHDFLRLLLNTRDFSVNKSVNIIRSQGKKAGKETLINYTRYAEESYFCFFFPIFSYKIKDQMRYPQKVYFADNSFLTNISLRFSKDYGRLYENLVAIELCRKRAENPLIEIYYWKNQHREVDFVVKQGLRVKQLIQVCYDIEHYDTKEREVKALIKGSKELRCGNLLVITEDYEADEKIGGKKIKYVPLWKWLLQRQPDSNAGAN